MNKEMDYMELYERNNEAMPQIAAHVITEGLGYGAGAISVTERMNENAANRLDAKLLHKVDALIESPSILVKVDVDEDGKEIDDDGCGDGRGVKVVTINGEVKKRSLNRKKVFGGGATMGVAVKIGDGSVQEISLEDVFSQTIDRFDEAGFNFGAHTDDHAEGDNCGCGAIDKAPIIIHNAVLYKTEILQSIEAITGQPSSENPYLENIFANYNAYSTAHQNDTYRGAKVMEHIANSGKVVKQLEGPHLEARIVINTVKGYTVDQAAVREITDGKVQVFAVDEWRIREIAEAMYDDPVEREQAYYSMLVYTLATGATLTSGDQKVYALAEQFAVAA